MVQKNRSAHKATIAKDVSPMRNMRGANKYALSASPSGGFCFGSRLTVPVVAQPAVTRDKWQYSDMINNNRDQFNNMHFC